MNTHRAGLLALSLLCLAHVGCAHCMYRMNCGYGCASCGIAEPGCACPEPGCACPEPGCACPEPGCACPEPGCACPEPGCYMPVGCGSCVGGCPIGQECPILGRIGRCLGVMFGCDTCGGCYGGCDTCCDTCDTCYTGGNGGHYAGGEVYLDEQPSVASRPSRLRRNVAADLRSSDEVGPRFR